MTTNSNNKKLPFIGSFFMSKTKNNIHNYRV